MEWYDLEPLIIDILRENHYEHLDANGYTWTTVYQIGAALLHAHPERVKTLVEDSDISPETRLAQIISGKMGESLADDDCPYERMWLSTRHMQYIHVAYPSEERIHSPHKPGFSLWRLKA